MSLYETWYYFLDLALGRDRGKDSSTSDESLFLGPFTTGEKEDDEPLTTLVGFVIKLVGETLWGAVSNIKKEEDGDRVQLEANDHATSFVGSSDCVHKSFSFAQLVDATNDFSNLIGENRCGTVYKGGNNQEIVVQMVNWWLSSLNHPNLNRLVGHCTEDGHRLLIFDYMRRGSLSDYIYDSSKCLDWDTRVSIALGVARGLKYLHNQTCRVPIVFRDLRPENVLLDANFSPKLSGFGNVGHVSAEDYYCAPEYAKTGRPTCKSDIFSFGILLFELFGKVPGQQWLLNSSVMRKMMRLGALCIRESPMDRPTMDTIVDTLELYSVASMKKIHLHQHASTSSGHSTTFDEESQTTQIRHRACRFNFWRLTVLELADVFSTYCLWMLPTCLNEELHVGHKKAALSMNGFWCVVTLLPVLVQFLCDVYTGNVNMALITTSSYCVGLAVLATCVHFQSRFWWISMLLLGIGVAGQKTISRRSVLSHADRHPSVLESCLNNILFAGVHVFGVVGIAMYLKEWWVRYCIAAGFIFVAEVIFVSGIGSYELVFPRTSPLTVIARVVVAAIQNHSVTIPPGSSHESREEVTVSRTRAFRYLDKAAIIRLGARGKWTVCTIAEVETVKRILYSVPLFMVICILGVISTVGDTYFFEEAKTMRRTVETIQVPLLVLPLVYKGSKFLSAILYSYRRESRRDQREESLRGVMVSALVAPFCCLVAFIVERTRLTAAEHHSTISIFVMFVQYLLLGCMDGLFEDNITFYFGQTPLDIYLLHFSMFFFRVGTLVSCTLSNIGMNAAVNIVIAWKNSPTGFDINRSRLDHYMFFLMLLGFMNYIISWFGWVLYNLVLRL